MELKARPGLITLTVAATALALGAAVLTHRLGLGLAPSNGLRLMGLTCGFVTVGACIFLIQRAMRRRARLDAIADLLPRYRPRRLEDEFVFEEPDPKGDFSERFPSSGRAEIRAATRALLVSLEEEMRRESVHARRPGRPACRRARLRAAGRAESRRRRLPPRVTASPS